jgi:hypothetical protein
MLLVGGLSEFRWSVDEPEQHTHEASGFHLSDSLKRLPRFVTTSSLYRPETSEEMSSGTLVLQVCSRSRASAEPFCSWNGGHPAE